MTLAVAAIIGGLIILVWSADRFVEGQPLRLAILV